MIEQSGEKNELAKKLAGLTPGMHLALHVHFPRMKEEEILFCFIY
jgi:hypothetical protein